MGLGDKWGHSAGTWGRFRGPSWWNETFRVTRGDTGLGDDDDDHDHDDDDHDHDHDHDDDHDDDDDDSRTVLSDPNCGVLSDPNPVVPSDPATLRGWPKAP